MKTFHRRNLPHLHYNDGQYFLTYRLANSIPQIALQELQQEFNAYKKLTSIQQKRLFTKYDSLLDSNELGLNYLTIPSIAEIVKATLEFPNNKEYKLICYCIMPNHVHVVFELLDGNKGISKIMQSVKRISAREANIVLRRSGQFWQDESFDRLVRDERELFNIVKYVLMNPVKAGLVDDWKKWNNTYCHPNYLVL
ncbi:MAG: transposase [Bacteroidetes bacterium]|nr:transposase [Bacteroidota bacterium]MBU1116587.1 transposase [Bacteroidota bacterium]MBU1797191.1 transposase [Bacteroidota bacterium]